jgi:hypothetical protein
MPRRSSGGVEWQDAITDFRHGGLPTFWQVGEVEPALARA